MLFHNHNNDPTTIAMHHRVQQQLARVRKNTEAALYDLAKVILDLLPEDRDGNGCQLSKEYDRFQQLDLELVTADLMNTRLSIMRRFARHLFKVLSRLRPSI
jgi:hypothetical protein